MRGIRRNDGWQKEEEGGRRGKRRERGEDGSENRVMGKSVEDMKRMEGGIHGTRKSTKRKEKWKEGGK